MQDSRRNVRRWSALTLGILTALSMLFSGCRTVVNIEAGDRVRKVAPGDAVPALEPGASYWVLIDDVRFKQFLTKIGPGE
jgi:hypothetical protein